MELTLDELYLGKSTIIKNKEFKIKINKVGMEQHIKINRVMVLPQSLAPIITNRRYIDSRVVVIDIGSGTIDVSEIIKGKLKSTLTVEKGCTKLYSKIAQKMNTEFGTKFNTDDVESMIEDEVFILNGESRAIDKYIEDIKRRNQNQHIRTNLNNICIRSEQMKQWYTEDDQKPNNHRRKS